MNLKDVSDDDLLEEFERRNLHDEIIDDYLDGTSEQGLSSFSDTEIVEYLEYRGYNVIDNGSFDDNSDIIEEIYQLYLNYINGSFIEKQLKSVFYEALGKYVY